MNYIGLNTCDTANGPGVRVSLFVSGCRMHCKGCFNPESWDFNAGKPFTAQTVFEIIAALREDHVAGLSILGGDPLEPENEPEVRRLCECVRAVYGDKKTIWLWTGRTHEKVKDLPVVSLIDVLVDGPFIEKHKDTTPGSWRGSTNQRVIEIKKA